MKLNLKFADHNTQVQVKAGLLFDPCLYPKELGIAIITDQHVANLYGKKLLALLQAEGRKAHLFSFQAGEENKTRAVKEKLEDAMLAQGLGKDTCIIALGGGCVMDLGGFIASTYCRGIPLILAPTTLLGMVDAAIGGKNGVNTSFGKNLIGTIYQPKLVIMDLSVLKTLPLNEIRNGLAEVIKHGLIADPLLFDFVQKNKGALLNLDESAIRDVAIRSIEIKQLVVETDEKEGGARYLLNFGHTIGHAIELMSGYKVPHGEAVAAGCIAESFLSYKMGYLPQESVAQIERLFEDFGYPRHRGYSFSDLRQAISADKKSKAQVAHFVLLEKIGKAKETLVPIDPQHLEEMHASYCH